MDNVIYCNNNNNPKNIAVMIEMKKDVEQVRLNQKKTIKKKRKSKSTKILVIQIMS